MLESFFGENLDMPVDRAWSKTLLKKISGLEFFRNLEILAVKNRKIRIRGSFYRSTPRADRGFLFI